MPFDQTRRILVTAFAGAPFLPASFISAHAADRPVTPEEMRQIADTLQREGFTRWGKVAFDDGRFEVDDAVGADGQKYELKLSNLDFSIIARKLDD